MHHAPTAGMLAMSVIANNLMLYARASSQPGRRMEQYEDWQR